MSHVISISLLVLAAITMFVAGFLLGRREPKTGSDGLLEVIEQDHEHAELLLKIDSDVFFKDLPKKQYVTLKVTHRKI